ncbi:MAG: 2Fe-2S iron-sulfur cluster binding domain-containing protein [Mycobacterium sp.]|nr:2Fe-2S iron-sulfur cluster binding domain-containing protein [Mycobacterium sp.]
MRQPEGETCMTLDSDTRCAVSDSADTADGGTVTITLDGKTVSVPLNPKETLLESARRGGLVPPYSCEAGNCGTCIATVKEGKVTMRQNKVLSDEEIEEGLVLTCQGMPETTVVVDYDD